MTMNDDGWERFEPWIAIDTEPERPGFVRLPDLELCPDADGRPRFRLSLHVREERAEDVRAAFRESRARSPLRRTAAE
jgi:hypothetical protein